MGALMLRALNVPISWTELGTIWSTSSGLNAIIDTLNQAYDIQEARPWWKVKLIALGLTIALAVFIVISFTLVLVGPTLAEKVAVWAHMGPAFAWTWKILQWPLVFLMLWFYLSALAVLIGAELNAEIEHASPYGKDPGEKVAGLS